MLFILFHRMARNKKSEFGEYDLATRHYRDGFHPVASDNPTYNEKMWTCDSKDIATQNV